MSHTWYGRSLKDRFLSKIKKTKGCWLWTACKNKAGYGTVYIGEKNKQSYLAHRYSYKLKYGSIGKNISVCHKCDNPSCVRPSHLFLGTHQDNSDDCKKKNRMRRASLENSGRAVLTNKQAIEIHKKWRPYYYTVPMLSKEYGVSVGALRKMLKRATWKSLVV